MAQFWPFGAISMSLFFEPFRDNKPWRRALSIAFGVAFVIGALFGVKHGHITVTKMNYTVHAAGNPPVFWLVTCAIIGLGIGCIVRGIRGKRD